MKILSDAPRNGKDLSDLNFPGSYECSGTSRHDKKCYRFFCWMVLKYHDYPTLPQLRLPQTGSTSGSKPPQS